MYVQLCVGVYICVNIHTYVYMKMLYIVNSLPERTQVYSLALPSHTGVKINYNLSTVRVTPTNSHIQ